MKIDSLQTLFVEELKDVYNAEKQILTALPKMVKAASSSELKKAFQNHLDQTKKHVTRLEQVFEAVGEEPKGKKCKGMEGLLEEGKEVLEEDFSPETRDVGLISAAQRVEHYEIAAYGCLRTYADELGHEEASKLLQTTLDEEGEADKILSRIAETSVNTAAEAQTAD